MLYLIILSQSYVFHKSGDWIYVTLYGDTILFCCSIFVALWHHLNYYNFNGILLSDCVNPPSLFFNIFKYLFLFIYYLFGCTESYLQHVGSKFPDQGLKPGPLHWELRVLATGPPGKSPSKFILQKYPIFWLFATCHLELLCQFSLSHTHTHLLDCPGKCIDYTIHPERTSISNNIEPFNQFINMTFLFIHLLSCSYLQITCISYIRSVHRYLVLEIMIKVI